MIKYVAYIPKISDETEIKEDNGESFLLLPPSFTKYELTVYTPGRRGGTNILNDFLPADTPKKQLTFLREYGDVFDLKRYLSFFPYLKELISLEVRYEDIFPSANKDDSIVFLNLFEYFRYDLYYLLEIISYMNTSYMNNPNYEAGDQLFRYCKKLMNNPNAYVVNYLYNLLINNELCTTPFTPYPFYYYRLVRNSDFNESVSDDIFLKLYESSTGNIISNYLNAAQYVSDSGTDIRDTPLNSGDIKEIAQNMVNDFLGYHLSYLKIMPIYPIIKKSDISYEYPSLIFALYHTLYIIASESAQIKHCADPSCGNIFIVSNLDNQRKKYCCHECAHRHTNRKSASKRRNLEKSPK